MQVMTTQPTPAASAPQPTPDGGAQDPTTPLPQLRPLQSRIVFHEFAQTALADRYIDVIPDVTDQSHSLKRYRSFEDALTAARELSSTTKRPLSVLQSTNGVDNMFLLHPLLVVASGGLRAGDVTRPASTWRGSTEPMPRWNDSVARASIIPLAVATQSHATPSGHQQTIRAIVTPNTALDGVRKVTGDGEHQRPLPWTELAAAR